MSYGNTAASSKPSVASFPTFGLRAQLEESRKLREGGKGKALVGAWHMLPGANLARLVAQQGWNFLLVDTEHGNIGDAEMHSLVAAVGAVPGCSPVVRIAAPDGWLVKRALDTGAHALMCPMISNAEEAKRLVSAARFPTQKGSNLPGGIRGVGSPFAPAVWGRTLQEYIDTANQSLIVIAQIENPEGLKNCEEIAAVDGIDMLFVGPNDLACSMGFRAADHENIPEVQEAIERIRKAAVSNGKYAGMFCTQPEQVNRRAEQGFDFMNCGLDISGVLNWNGAALNTIGNVKHVAGEK